jgi:tetratricopeptide (TPR) repeat protein
MIILVSAGPLLAGYYEQGRSFFVYKKYDKAKEMFLKATEKREHGDALYFLGEIEKIQGNFKTAEDYFARCVASGSTTGKYLKNAY